MKFNFNRIISQTKSTQILYGLIGSFYGATQIVEYYPRKITNSMAEEYNSCLKDAKNNTIDKYSKEIAEFKQIIDNSNDDIDKIQKYSFIKYFLSVGQILTISMNNAILQQKIDKNSDFINMVNDKEFIQQNEVEKPLFLIENDNFSTNIVFSSVFYGTIFTVAGVFPVISFVGLSSYVVFNRFFNNKTISDDKTISNK